MSYTTQQILSKVTDLVDAFEQVSGTTIVPKTLSDANDTVEEGFYEATTLSTVDPQLVSDNIKTGVTIFGVVGAADIQDIGDADLTVGEAPTGKKFYAVSGGVKTGTGTKTLTDDNETVAAGYYAATTLSAVDAHLASANIKSGVSIFGKAGAATVQEIGAADAAVGNVLATKTFFSVTGAIKTGVMPNNAGDVAAVSAHMGATTNLHVVPAAGYTDGTDDATVIDLATVDADLVEGKIKAGTTLLGVLGTYETVITGDAIVGNVLDGKTFYSTDATSQLEGTMPDNDGDVAAISSHVDGTSIHVVPATGYTDGVTDATVITDADFIPGNILFGKTVFGLEGTTPSVVDTTTGDVADHEMLVGKVGWANGAEITGNVPAGDDVVGDDGDLEILIPAGLYVGTEHTTASDTNLVAGKIKDGVTIFGVEGTYDESATPITATTVQTGLEGFVNGSKVTGSGTKTLSAADDHVHAGYYEETTLAAVDTDLAVGNIKTGVTIFGKAGTFTADAATAATGTVTSDGQANVTEDDTVLIDAKTYTFMDALTTDPTTVEGEVLIGDTVADSLQNLTDAINHTGTSAQYSCAAAHSTVEASRNSLVVSLEAATAGVAGNAIDLVATGATLTASGAHLAGGTQPATANELQPGCFAWVGGVKITGTVS